ncbi:hypothetical protein ACFE04_010589 [Oxalis oulophora]
MRPQQWRLLLFRNHLRFPLQIASNHSSPQLMSHSHSFSSLFNSNPTILPKPTYPFTYSMMNFSSTSAIDDNNNDKLSMTPQQCAVAGIIGVFEKFTDLDDLKRELELNGVVLSYDLVCQSLRGLESKPDVGKRFFDYVLVADGKLLSSKAYNSMLRILGVNGLVMEFWGLVDTMQKKGFGVSAHVRDKVVEKFEKEGLKEDLLRLKEVFATGSTNKSIDMFGSKMSKIIKTEVWGDAVEKKLRELNVPFSSDLVKLVLENLSTEPSKGLIFFRWISEGGLFKHDERTYNALARVLGREDCIDKLWNVLNEMRNDGFELEMETYVKVLGRFIKRKMINESVDLFEFAMAGKIKPHQSCMFLLRKIVVAKEFDMALFCKVVAIYTENGNTLTDTMFDSVLKSLASVDRLEECNLVLKTMKEHGYAASGKLLGKAAFRLSSTRKTEQASEFMDHVEESGSDFKHKTLASLVEGHCVAGNLEKASHSFYKLIENGGVSSAGYAFEMLVNAYSRKSKSTDACKLLHKYVDENSLRPWHDTYKKLIKKLLVQREFKSACSLLGSMRGNGYPPFIDPFIEYLSKSGNADETIVFLRAMTSKAFPSTSVALRVFEAFFQARKHGVAQDVLAMCPHFIRDHPDVLNLFWVAKSGNKTVTLPVTA